MHFDFSRSVTIWSHSLSVLSSNPRRCTLSLVSTSNWLVSCKAYLFFWYSKFRSYFLFCFAVLCCHTRWIKYVLILCEMFNRNFRSIMMLVVSEIRENMIWRNKKKNNKTRGAIHINVDDRHACINAYFFVSSIERLPVRAHSLDEMRCKAHNLRPLQLWPMR